MERKAVILVCLAVTAAAAGMTARADRSESSGETLYNGIRLPEPWPPRRANFSPDPETPPYLASPPGIIPIDVGRQLFVDDFLIESTTLKRTYRRPAYDPQNPVLKPDEAWERRGSGPMAMPFSDGVWFDPRDRLFKMWYYAGYRGAATCWAFSQDGLHWTKPKLDVVAGTNIVHQGMRDSGAVWLDDETADPGERFKMALYDSGRLILFRSPDGIHWTRAGDAGHRGDRSTFFYNPFRKRWVYSLRSSSAFGRSRLYWETPDFFSFTDEALKNQPPVPWMIADSADPRRDDLNVRPELYNLDCVAYESLILGFFSIWRGDYRAEPQTETWRKMQGLGRPKQNAVFIGFSRDGFHWYRPDRREFFPVSEKPGDWNWGNVQSVANGCVVVGDMLYFYVSGRAGKSFPGCEYADAGGSTGLARLRRDGFASMEAAGEEGSLTTRPVRFSGKFLFVNVNSAPGDLRAEVLDERGRIIPPFGRDNCRRVVEDGTCVPVSWKGAPDLSALAGRVVRFRFYLRRGELYSFWVSPEASGASYGYVAGGGPGYPGPRDTVGVSKSERR